MAEKIKAELLSFLKGSELPLSILVVESVGYLPALRRQARNANRSKGRTRRRNILRLQQLPQMQIHGKCKS